MGAAIPIGIRGIGHVLKRALPKVRGRPGVAVIPQDVAKEGDCSTTRDDTQCNQCKLQTGVLLPSKPRRAIRAQTKINYDYQLYIANLKAGPEHFSYCDKDTGLPVTNFDLSIAGRAWSALKGEAQPNPEQLNITEWLYNGVWFDGFWSSECTVVDAKGRYAQFLDEDGRPKRGFPANAVFPDLVKEAATHAVAIASAQPQGKVEWHFMEAATYYVARQLIPSPIAVHLTPLPPVQA
jgi:hypothetical protein